MWNPSDESTESWVIKDAVVSQENCHLRVTWRDYYDYLNKTETTYLFSTQFKPVSY